MSGKMHKYSVKIYKVAGVNGYTWNFYGLYWWIRFNDESWTCLNSCNEFKIGDLLGYYQTLVADNFFTNISLAKCLLQNCTYLTGAFRSNRARSGHEVVQKKFKRNDAYGFQSKDGIKLIKWKDKRRCLDDIHKAITFGNVDGHEKNQ